MRLVWDENAWDDYLWWQAQDRKVLKRINQLIQDVLRNGNEGIGRPEPLRHDFAGYWSRRITDEHRLVYKYTEAEVRIAACRYHYGATESRPVRGETSPIMDIMYCRCPLLGSECAIPHDHGWAAVTTLTS